MPSKVVLHVLTDAFFSSVSNQSIPLIPWTSEQEEAFSSPTFRQLLGELGFHLPSDTGKLFPRIPHFWCPDVLFMVAKRLGDITESKSLICTHFERLHSYLYVLAYFSQWWMSIQLSFLESSLFKPRIHRSFWTTTT